MGRRCCKKELTFSNFTSSGHFVQRIVNICAALEEGIHYKDLDARKPGICEEHRRRPTCASAQSVICLLKNIITELAMIEISLF